MVSNASRLVLIALTAGLVTSTAWAGGKTAYDRYLEDAWSASQRDHDWVKAEQCFIAASKCGQLREGDYGGLRVAQRLQGKHADALRTALEGYRLYKTRGLALGLCEAYIDTGDFADARSLLAKVLSAGEPSEAEKPQIDGIRSNAGFREWELAVVLDCRELGPPANEQLKKNGYYKCYYPADVEYQVSKAVASDCQRYEEGLDRVGNRFLRIWPRDNQLVRVRMTVTQIPKLYDLSRLDGTAYAAPAEVKHFLGVTPDIDPTTETAREIARGLKSGDWRQTVRNTMDWWRANLKAWDIEAARIGEKELVSRAQAVRDQGYNGSDFMLRFKIGRCGITSEAICALLRANGIAARPALGFTGVDAGPDDHKAIPAGWHTWVELYAPGCGWVPIENGVRVGQLVRCFIRLATITPEDNPRSVTTNARIFSLMYGKDNITAKLNRVTLELPKEAR